MKTSFLSLFLVKLKQIHIDKSITTSYSTDILQCPMTAWTMVVEEYDSGGNLKGKTPEDEVICVTSKLGVNTKNSDLSFNDQGLFDEVKVDVFRLELSLRCQS